VIVRVELVEKVRAVGDSESSPEFGVIAMICGVGLAHRVYEVIV